MERQECDADLHIPQVSWYPGHIAKSLRLLRQQVGLIDLALELVDARLPEGSRIPDLDQVAGHRECILVSTKADLADPETTRQWRRAWEKRGLSTTLVNAQTGQGVPALLRVIQRRAQALSERLRSRGRLSRPPRVMVLGLPNVGKSSLINRLVRRGKVAVADRPGVTRAFQWVRIGPQVELLDTPGVMPPRLDTPLLGLKLALVGCLPEQAYDPIDMAAAAIHWLNCEFPGYLYRRYEQPLRSLQDFATIRQFRLAGLDWDIPRAARTFIHEFRHGQWGPITLEPITLSGR